MAESDYKKYWYIKLPKEFFNRHDIKILEAQTNGKDYCLFYLKLLLESVTHNGELRFNETIPYDEEMLSVVTNTNIDVVRSAMKVLVNLKLVEIYEDKTIFMTEVQKMMGYDTGAALRKKDYRDRLKGDNVPQVSHDSPIDVPESKNKSKSNSKELELDKELKLKEIKNKENSLDINYINSHLNESDDETEEVVEESSRVGYRTIKNFFDKHNILGVNIFSEMDYIAKNDIKDWQSYLLNKYKRSNNETS